MSWVVDKVRLPVNKPTRNTSHFSKKPPTAPKRRKREIKPRAQPQYQPQENHEPILEPQQRFEDYLAERYARLVDETYKKYTLLQEELNSKQAQLSQIAHSASRGHIREKFKLERDIEQCKKAINAFSREKIVDEFKAKVLPYIYAYQREQDIIKMRTLIAKPLEKTNAQPTSSAALSQIHSVFQEYKQNIEDDAPEVIVMHQEICDECDDVMILEPRSSVLMCPYCSNWKPYLDATSSHMAYGEEVEFTSFAYIRLNHFNERLTYAQAKESNQIPGPVIQRVMCWLYEHDVRRVEDVTLEQTYNAMKELKLRAYYKQNTQLWCRITGNAPLRMSPEHEEQLRLMFKSVQRLWLKYKPDDRKNFLSYNYCLYKFNELLGYDDFLPYFKLLKGHKKLQKQDEIYKNICEDPELRWTFIPSV